MTLMDAPKYDAARSERRFRATWITLAGLVVLLIAGWLVAGRPLDFPWTWWSYWTGERATSNFLTVVESNDLARAYGLWENDPDWQQHADQYKSYPFSRFQEDWGQNSSANDYGTISSHQIVVKKRLKKSLVVGYLINGRKSKPLFLDYDLTTRTLGFSPFELSYQP